MADLIAEMVDRRYETVASGTYSPEIPGLPGITFIKMGLKERGASSRAYSAKLIELMNQGGYFSEALLPTILERTCRENGIDMAVLQKNREIVKRLFDAAPEDLIEPIDELTDEEAALLSPEQKAERERYIEDRGRRIADFMTSFFTANDQKIMDQAKQIENLELQLRNNTAEHNARKYQMEMEILLCARKSDNIDQQYFSCIDEIQELDDTNQAGLIQLFMKWKQFKSGLLPQFFRPNNPEMH